MILNSVSPARRLGLAHTRSAPGIKYVLRAGTSSIAVTCNLAAWDASSAATLVAKLTAEAIGREMERMGLPAGTLLSASELWGPSAVGGGGGGQDVQSKLIIGLVVGLAGLLLGLGLVWWLYVSSRQRKKEELWNIRQSELVRVRPDYFFALLRSFFSNLASHSAVFACLIVLGTRIFCILCTKLCTNIDIFICNV